MAEEAYQTAVDKGWYENEVPDERRLLLIHSEISEATEWLRGKGDRMDDKIPKFTGLEAELADVLIRIFDWCGASGLNVAGAVIAKMKYNQGREYKHGGKEF